MARPRAVGLGGAVCRTLFVVALSGPTPGRLAAQPSPTLYPEFRADAILARGTTAQGGVGIVTPLGVYVRFGLDGAVGETRQDGVSSASGRVDAIARFLLDPLRERGTAISVGGGLSMPFRNDGPKAPYLTVVVDVEGKALGGITPALELGLGGGGRIGVVLRRSPPRWR